MSRKWIGVVVAVALAAVGTWILVRYVQGAENRALEGEETVAVLIVDSPVPAGSAAQDIENSVRVELVPSKVQALGSLGSLEELNSLGELVASVDLVPGEQVISERFITAQTLEEQDDIIVPDGLVEVTLSLTPERSIGGVLRPGGHVAVFASFEPFDLNAVEPGTEEEQVIGGVDPDPENPVTGNPVSSAVTRKTPNTTHIILHKVLVTNVQVEELPQDTTSGDGDGANLEISPTGNLLVTLALGPEDAERFVFTAEFGTVWLAEESSSVDESGTSVQNRNTVYEDPLVEE